MAFGGTPTVESPSSLQQMLTEINEHRSSEIRLFTKEDSGFVLVNSSSFWTDLFVRHFLSHVTNDEVGDDLLFFVRKQPKKIPTKYIPQYDTVLEVFRKDSKKLPIGDNDIDWEETVYLNLIMQQFQYTLTCAICTRTSPKELQILKRHSQRVYASPSRRSMDCKGEMEEITYPNIFFTVDNYDEIFEDILVRDGEMVCVELVASDRQGTAQGVIFLGSIRYEALKRVYDTRASLSSRMAQKMSMGWYQGHQRIEFVRMRGPQGRGHAEMAVTKQKGSGVETPTSEPGVSITDYDWEELEENPYQQRRMSDPSSNLNNFVRGWRTRSDMKKSRSENEGVDSYANGVNEIEAGDLRDVAKPEKNHEPYQCRIVSVKQTNNNQYDHIKVSYFCPCCVKNSHDSSTPSFNEPDKDGELDDTTYNRLWMMKGFSQAYHFWKETRRANSPALHSYITYVTLPWHQIVAELLDTRQEPLLTF